ncbi:hypothetical protein H3H36_00625 [Duganella sp. FT3S]|uniref:Integrase n=1 Tax=Rugamonas fusca TaxID=2758568 RepID=A0A7W2EDI8_9BURK|nr:hypothetical protein [Rugamonas fusca]MBA5603866.1 hypothetical protein [Rugamonas fusca]
MTDDQELPLLSKARKLILPSFVLTEVCEASDAGAVQIALPLSASGMACYERPKRAITGLRIDKKPKWKATEFNLYPIVLDTTGLPWVEANLYILSRLEEALEPSMSTYDGIADDLAAYRRFIDEEAIDWQRFAAQKLSRPTYRYSSHLRRAVEARVVSASVAKRRMGSVIAFYSWMTREGLLTPDFPPWRESDVFLKLTAVNGLEFTRRVTTTDLSILTKTQFDPYDGRIEDGGKLRPLSHEEQRWVVEALLAQGNTEMTLIHLLALFTGARIQTVLTFQVQHVRQLAAKQLDPQVSSESRCPIGPGSTYGCRYAHAEFSANEDAITHFDGAIRAYPAEAYFDRIDTSIDKAGKHSDYSKLFRLDGGLPISDWKRLLTDYFQGNALIPEYLGSTIAEGHTVDEPADEEPELINSDVKLAVLVRLDCGAIGPSLSLIPELSHRWGEKLIPFVEVGIGATEAFLTKRLDLSKLTAIGFEDGILNLSRLCFGTNDQLDALFRGVVSDLSDALEQDVQSGLVLRAAIPIAWRVQDTVVTLSIAGEGRAVVDALRKVTDIIDPLKEPHEWIEPVSNWVRKLVAGEKNPVLWRGVQRGVLEIGRSGVVGMRARMPDDLRNELIESGDLNISSDVKTRAH